MVRNSYFSAENIPLKNMKIQKSPFQNHEPLFFKDFPAKNISFENASPKMGKFIDWDFTVTVLGGCKWCFGGGLALLTDLCLDYDTMVWYVCWLIFYGVVSLGFCILSK